MNLWYNNDNNNKKENHMRDINRIEPLLNEIRKLWYMVPDWRLGQLISNAARSAGYEDCFFIEDEDLKKVIEEMNKQAEKQEQPKGGKSDA